MIRNLISGLISSLVFLLLFLGLNWHILISLALSAGVFASLYLLLKPQLKIGSYKLEMIEDGDELLKIMDDAKDDLAYLDSYLKKHKRNDDIKVKVKDILTLGHKILNKMENNPRLISSSRHFLTYYVDRARKIVENYEELKEAYEKDEKFEKINKSTLESLGLLKEVFENTRDDIYKDKLLELELENELLEKTVKLGRSLNEK